MWKDWDFLRGCSTQHNRKKTGQSSRPSRRKEVIKISLAINELRHKEITQLAQTESVIKLCREGPVQREHARHDQAGPAHNLEQVISVHAFANRGTSITRTDVPQSLTTPPSTRGLTGVDNLQALPDSPPFQEERP